MPGFCPPKSCAWLRWTKLASIDARSLMVKPIPSSGANRILVAEFDIIVAGVLEIVGVAAVDGDAKARPDNKRLPNFADMPAAA